MSKELGWLEMMPLGATFYLHNCLNLLYFRPKEYTMTPAMKAAWIAYYESIRDNPVATSDEKARAIDMLAKGERLGIAREPEVDVSQFA